MDEKQNEELVAYCGLYCGDCFGYQGKISSLASELNEELKKVNFKRNADFFANLPFFKAFKNYDRFMELLETMGHLTCDGCREKGGSPTCEIRECCQQNDFTGCWVCAEFETCEKLEFLKEVHGDGNLKNLRNLKEKGVEGFIMGERCW